MPAVRHKISDRFRNVMTKEKRISIRGIVWLIIIVTCIIGLLGQAIKEGGYTEDIAPKLGSYYCQSHGKVNMPVFMVEFPDLKFDPDHLTKEEVEKKLFDKEDSKSFAYFEERSSYGRLSLSGKVYGYTTKHPETWYKNDEKNFEDLAMEVLSAFDKEIDYTKYDADKDGMIDAFTLNIAGSDDYWYGCQATWWSNPDFCVDGEKPSVYILNDAAPLEWNMTYYVQEMAHEFGHCMGLPDLYKYDVDDYEAMKGSAGTELMDEMTGDYSQFSKLILGWLKESNVLICDPAGKGIQKFVIKPSNDKGNCIIIPRKLKADLSDMVTDEYFLIQYDIPDGLMKDVDGIPKDGGIRIFHIEASVYNDEYGGQSFTYNGFSPHYDKNHKGKRIIRLVNDGEGYFNLNSVINDEIPGFAWYNKKGKEKEKTGLVLEVKELDGNRAEIVVTGL